MPGDEQPVAMNVSVVVAIDELVVAPDDLEARVSQLPNHDVDVDLMAVDLSIAWRRLVGRGVVENDQTSARLQRRVNLSEHVAVTDHLVVRVDDERGVERAVWQSRVVRPSVNQLDVTQRMGGDELLETLEGLLVDVDREHAALLANVFREALGVEAVPSANVGNATPAVDCERSQDVLEPLPLLAALGLGNGLPGGLRNGLGTGPAWRGGREKCRGNGRAPATVCSKHVSSSGVRCSPGGWDATQRWWRCRSTRDARD